MATMPHVDEIRAFNRFYTGKIGALSDSLLRSPFSLAEARVIYELANRERPTATELGRELGLDAGYLSRILRGFEKKRLVGRKPSPADGRQSLLVLTGDGRRAFAKLNGAARSEVEELLQPLAGEDRDRLVGAMRTIRELLNGPSAEPYVLRTHQPGDMGWVVSRHGALYAAEYRWTDEFEALVAEIAAKFLRKFDSAWERCWIAERNGERVGSVFLVKHSATVAQLRLLLVEPKARGLGIGGRLVEECIRFTRERGYRKMMLWTNSVLDAARHIYQKAGFELVREEKHHSFGHDLTGQTWEMKL
jgi:DNA-binding MarR family transcriptional regulator/GNAT superfamily N-acetyltransferase